MMLTLKNDATKAQTEAITKKIHELGGWFDVWGAFSVVSFLTTRRFFK